MATVSDIKRRLMHSEITFDTLKLWQRAGSSAAMHTHNQSKSRQHDQIANALTSIWIFAGHEPEFSIQWQEGERQR